MLCECLFDFPSTQVLNSNFKKSEFDTFQKQKWILKTLKKIDRRHRILSNPIFY